MPKGKPDETCGDHGGTNSEKKPCGRAAGWGTDFDSGKCRRHRGTSPDGSSHEGNQNAVTHGAFSEHFQNDLTKTEREAFEDAKQALENPKDAQEIARTAAAEVLLKYKRSGDERFLRRFEGICDKFGLTPNEELSVEHSGEMEHTFGVGELTDDDREFIESLSNE